MTDEDLKDQVLRVIDQGKDIFIFSTVDEDGQPHARYMAILDQEDDNSAFYLGTQMSSRKMQHLKNNPNAQMLFITPDYLQVASVHGQAQDKTTDRLKHRLWERFPVLAGYFSGADDPDFGVIRFEPEYAEFLDFNKAFEPVRVPWKEEALQKSAD